MSKPNLRAKDQSPAQTEFKLHVALILSQQLTTLKSATQAQIRYSNRVDTAGVLNCCCLGKTADRCGVISKWENIVY